MAIILQRQEAVAGPQGSFPALTEKCLVKKNVSPVFICIYFNFLSILLHIFLSIKHDLVSKVGRKL